MNKVVTLNLNGNAYQLEEPGYAALSTYLSQARSRLGDNPDREEITADIEQAIADKLSRFLSVHKSVVTSEEVNTVIAEMGPVEAAGSEKNAGSRPKRLYRIHQGEILGGVATGFAAYFNVDVILVRVIMIVLLVLSGGSFVFGYVLAWIFIPPARTQEEEAKAYGEPYTAEEIIARAKAVVEKGHAAGMKQLKAWKRMRREERRAAARAYTYSYDGWNWHGRRSSNFGQLIGLIILSFLGWLGYHQVPLVHDFMVDVWALVQYVSDSIAQVMVSSEK